MALCGSFNPCAPFFFFSVFVEHDCMYSSFFMVFIYINGSICVSIDHCRSSVAGLLMILVQSKVGKGEGEEVLLGAIPLTFLVWVHLFAKTYFCILLSFFVFCLTSDCSYRANSTQVQ